MMPRLPLRVEIIKKSNIGYLLLPGALQLLHPDGELIDFLFPLPALDLGPDGTPDAHDSQRLEHCIAPGLLLKLGEEFFGRADRHKDLMLDFVHVMLPSLTSSFR